MSKQPKFVKLFNHNAKQKQLKYKKRKDLGDIKIAELNFLFDNIPSIMERHPRKIGFYDNACYEWSGPYSKNNVTPLYNEYTFSRRQNVFKKRQYTKSTTARKFIYLLVNDSNRVPLHHTIEKILSDNNYSWIPKPKRKCLCDSGKLFMNCHMITVRHLSCENYKCVNPWHYILMAPVDDITDRHFKKIKLTQQ